MKKHIQGITSTLLAVILMATLLALPAGATATQGVDIYFCKPASWNDSVKIHLWNAGSYNTTWPGVAMTNLGDGWYRYTNSALNSCSVVINDGNGNQTADLNVTDQVTIKDNKVVPRAQKYIAVNFTRPSNWGTDIKIYSYSDDSSQLEIYSWPGVSMTSTGYANQYTYRITELEKARVLFTDGVNQYPPQGHAGIPVEAGQQLFCDTNGTENRVTPNISVSASKSTVNVNETFTITMDNIGFSNGISCLTNDMQVISSTVSGNQKIYNVKFTQPGYKMIYTTYQSGYGGDPRAHQKDGCIGVDITVV